MKNIYLFVIALLAVIATQAQAPALQDSATGKSAVDSALTRVEYESSFPGGEAGWRRFLQTTLVYPVKAERKKIEGTVVTRFIVEKDGRLSNIEAMSGPELLKDAAIKVLQQSPSWKPAFQHGKKVRSYKIQPITFRLA